MSAIVEARRFLQALREEPGKVKGIRNTNPSGTLWTSEWKFEGGEYVHNTIASGVFTRPSRYDYPQALRKVANTIEHVQQTREEWQNSL